MKLREAQRRLEWVEDYLQAHIERLSDRHAAVGDPDYCECKDCRRASLVITYLQTVIAEIEERQKEQP